jgi:hypothetical protein
LERARFGEPPVFSFLFLAYLGAFAQLGDRAPPRDAGAAAGGIAKFAKHDDSRAEADAVRDGVGSGSGPSPATPELEPERRSSLGGTEPVSSGSVKNGSVTDPIRVFGSRTC